MGIYIILFLCVLMTGFFGLTKIVDGRIYWNAECSERQKRVFIICVFLAFCLIQGFREKSVGVDTIGYLDYFQMIYTNAADIDFASLDFRDIEIGYVAVNILISIITTNEQFFILAVSSIILALHLFFLRINSRNIFLSVVLFMGFGHFFTSMVSLRQYTAIGIAMWMIPAVRDKKYKRAACIGFIAFLFHNSVIVFMMAIFAAGIFRRKFIYAWMILAGLLITLPVTNIIKDYMIYLVPKYAFYDAFEAGGVGKLRMVLIAFYLFLMFTVARRKDCRNEYLNILCTMLSFAVYTSLLGAYLPWGFRLTYYFDYAILLLIPEIISRNKKNQVLYECVIVAVSFMIFCYLLATNAGQVVPYKFCI